MKETVTIIRCDRCGNETHNKATIVAAWNLSMDRRLKSSRAGKASIESTELDLCESCEASFRDWVQGRGTHEPVVQRFRTEQAENADNA